MQELHKDGENYIRLMTSLKSGLFTKYYCGDQIKETRLWSGEEFIAEVRRRQKYKLVVGKLEVEGNLSIDGRKMLN
jgi:hypothetical protein